MILYNRPRILRKSSSIRDLVQETALSPNDFIAPIFVIEGENKIEKIPSMEGYSRRSIDLTIKEVAYLNSIGIKSILLFAKCNQQYKDNEGLEAINDNGLMQRAIRAIKKEIPKMCIFSDVALDPYSIYGHDGIVDNQEIVNDKTVDILCKMSLSHARAGADFIAPSDMMDGRIGEIRLSLEKNNFSNIGIMSYSAKYSSSFYGPFRDAMDSAPGFGDKKTYQMNPANRLEALKEIKLDIKQGADIIMIKPALSYLDIIREAKNFSTVPISAYQVSGEYAMIKASAEKGWIDESSAIFESLISIKRAGADLIATYFAKDIIKLLF